MSDLKDLAVEITMHLREHFPDSDEQTRQVLALAEEAGEFAEAYLAVTWHTGGWGDAAAELADVLITAHVTGVVLNIELPDSDTGDDFPALTGREHVVDLGVRVGRLVGAYRRWARMARRSGPWADVVIALAGVVAAAEATAVALGIDLDAAWRAKAAKILTRGWRDKPVEVTQ